MKHPSKCQCCASSSATGSTPSGEPVGNQEEVTMSSLIEVRAASLNGINQKIEEWEELEFMVDSGAGHTVVGPKHVKAVPAEEPEKARNNKHVGENAQ